MRCFSRSVQGHIFLQKTKLVMYILVHKDKEVYRFFCKICLAVHSSICTIAEPFIAFNYNHIYVSPFEALLIFYYIHLLMERVLSGRLCPPAMFLR